MTIPIPSLKTVFIIITTAVVCFLFFGHCGGAKPTIATNQLDSALREKSAVEKQLIRANVDIANLKILRDISDSNFKQAFELYQQADNDIHKEGARADKFAALYAAARLHKDTAQALNNCDSLEGQYTSLRDRYFDVTKNCDASILAKSRSLYLADSSAGVQARQIAGLRGALDLMGRSLNAVKEPWAKGYLSASVSAGNGRIGFGPELTLVTRKGLLLGAGAEFTDNGIVERVRVGKLITFKR